MPTLLFIISLLTLFVGFALMLGNPEARGPLYLAVAGVLLLIWSCIPAGARDLGQWGNADPELSAWYRGLKQPDSPVSCCGEADSYWCDERANGSQVQCVINDDRDDIALKRMPVPNGTIIDIPPNKINKDPNPTGHAVVFLSSAGFVWCFVGISGS